LQVPEQSLVLTSGLRERFLHMQYLVLNVCAPLGIFHTTKLRTQSCDPVDLMAKRDLGVDPIWMTTNGFDRGRCYGYNFLRFLTIFDKNGVFLKNQCYDPFFLQKLAVFSSKTTFLPIFRRKYFKK
jgi:hypothetical protein